jgi:hypothetical protein
MKMNLRQMIAAMVVLLALPATAEITATVRPGHVFAEGERPTTATLNQAANPTVQITGTLGGTNVALGANTVSGTMLMDSVAGSNLTWNASSPRGLVIANSGVDVGQIAASIAGNGLAGGAGTALSVTTAGNALSATNDALRIICPLGKLLGGDVNGFVTNVTVGTGLFVSATTLSISNFTTAEYALGSGGLIANTNHNMGATPAVVIWRLICKTADLGYEVGDEVDVASFYNSASLKPQFGSGANTTNLFLVEFSTSINVRRKDTGADDTITAGSWRAIGRARQ